jgi:hypothetical protein
VVPSRAAIPDPLASRHTGILPAALSAQVLIVSNFGPIVPVVSIFGPIVPVVSNFGPIVPVVSNFGPHGASSFCFIEEYISNGVFHL